jgi:hypothetical protein
MDLQRPHSAETMIPDACPVCGGDVHLRVTNGRGTSYCASCRWISHPRLQVHHDKLELALDTAAEA